MSELRIHLVLNSSNPKGEPCVEETQRMEKNGHNSHNSDERNTATPSDDNGELRRLH